LSASDLNGPFVSVMKHRSKAVSLNSSFSEVVVKPLSYPVPRPFPQEPWGFELQRSFVKKPASP
jgi:hypothetical protein